MKTNPFLKIALISAIAAIIVVVVLKMFGYENPTVIAGGVAGGIAGAVSSILLKNKTKV